MIVLTLRTDNPVAELGIYDDQYQIQYEVWPAHRQLAETVHTRLLTLLSAVNMQLSDLQGIVVFQGPGSFTGLRIGITIANTLAYSLQIPIVASAGSAWVEIGIAKLLAGVDSTEVLPEYGAMPHITAQKK